MFISATVCSFLLGILTGYLSGTYLTDHDIMSIKTKTGEELKIWKDDKNLFVSTYDKVSGFKDFVWFDERGHIDSLFGRYVKVIRKG